MVNESAFGSATTDTARRVATVGIAAATTTTVRRRTVQYVIIMLNKQSAFSSSLHIQ